ncbi:hypothetical protein [Halobacillus karajensis]|uniref:Uncharacterized protein n=1 Tax=Halobacillus karajensis TaxID=195088 RepID=A0A024P6D6_9BACI|nr:hypothetical protein [Halobacillus karajensis]CDQ17768.1 hypothetical protein BN982_00005 [Halobacillus karajensis]CDQ24176.1 hypothetical protein BN983_02444 [Halobacillus karajensis]CDQ29577.1 hypothetical protein BN981_03961 [Halobacillus karajensis]
MPKNQTETEVGQGRKENPKPVIEPGYSGTDPNKVKQEIQKDVSEGIGSMTSREAGSMRD